MIVKLVIYSSLALGIVLTQSGLIRSLVLSVVNKRRIRRDLKKLDRGRDRRYGKVLSHLQRVLEASRFEGMAERPEYFIMMSVSISAGLMFALYWMEGAAFSLLMAATGAVMPYLFVKMKLKRMRIGGSREGDILLSELLSQYKIHGENMREAIEAAANSIERAPHSRRILYDLAADLNRSYTRADTRRALDRFRYSIDTAWGNALANTIYYSHVHGIRVTDALEDLCASLISSRRVVEHARRENSESKMMLKYLAPASYAFSILIACRFFGFTISKFFRYQFLTPLGLRWFMISAAALCFGILAEAVLSREKMDI